MRSGPKPAVGRLALSKAIMAIWCICFCGMQWRSIGLLCGLSRSAHAALWAVRPLGPRLGLWRRLLNRLRRTWRLACGDTPEPKAP